MIKFQIVTNGELLLGYTKKEVTKNLSQLCKYDQKQMDKLFSSFPFTFKTGLTDETARRYKKALDRSGIDCRIEEVTDEIEIQIHTPGVRVISHHPRDKDEFKMKCPKCGKSQPKRLTCSDCDIVVEKFRRKPQATPHNLHPERQLAFDENIASDNPKRWLYLILFAVAGFSVYFGYSIYFS